MNPTTPPRRDHPLKSSSAPVRVGFAIVCGALICTSGRAGTLYAIDESSQSLVTIDRTTFAVTTVGPLGTTVSFGDLTYNPLNQTLYAVGGRGNDSLYTIDQSTGVATLVGSHGVDDMFALALDSSTGTMYAESADENLYTLNLVTGAATLVGATGVYPGGLAYNPITDQLLLQQAGDPGGIYEILRSTGAPTLLAAPGFINDNGFTYDGDLGGYWATDYNDQLYRYDNAFNRSTVANLGFETADVAYVTDVPESATAMSGWIGLGLFGAVTCWRRAKSAK